MDWRPDIYLDPGHICPPRSIIAGHNYPVAPGKYFKNILFMYFIIDKNNLQYYLWKHIDSCSWYLIGEILILYQIMTWCNGMETFSAFLVIHCSDVIMGAVASQITRLIIVYSTVYSDADQRKHQSSASLVFVRGIHRWPVNSPHR